MLGQSSNSGPRVQGPEHQQHSLVMADQSPGSGSRSGAQDKGSTPRWSQAQLLLRTRMQSQSLAWWWCIKAVTWGPRGEVRSSSGSHSADGQGLWRSQRAGTVVTGDPGGRSHCRGSSSPGEQTLPAALSAQFCIGEECGDPWQQSLQTSTVGINPTGVLLLSFSRWGKIPPRRSLSTKLPWTRDRVMQAKHSLHVSVQPSSGSELQRVSTVTSLKSRALSKPSSSLCSCLFNVFVIWEEDEHWVLYAAILLMSWPPRNCVLISFASFSYQIFINL